MSSINTATVTQEDIQQAETGDLLKLYNEITGDNVKKFADRKTAERRTWKAIQQLPPGADINKAEKKIKKEKHSRKRIMRFCFAPGSVKDQHEPKKSSLRFRVFEMLNKKNGALFSEIQKEFKWHSKNTYEAVRLVHRTTNYGMWSNVEKDGDIRIRLITDSKEYSDLVSSEKKAA